MAHMASTSRSRSPGVDDIPPEPEERGDSQLNPKHTIFLSHSGEQKAFTEQLYVDLKTRGQSPFFDQDPKSLPKGEVFAGRILEAAKNCVVAVVVLSNEFLESKWPMLELVTFVEAQKTLNPKLKIFPLFYKLEPSDLKEANKEEEGKELQSQIIKEPTITRMTALWTEMAKADERIRPDECEKAVKVLARANGAVFSRYGGSEVAYRKAIVDALCILCQTYAKRRVPPNMVGRERLCKVMKGEFEKSATRSGFFEARILGLYGMGGTGKSFICKALCDHYSDEYSGRVCYVECSDGVYLDLLKLILEELTDIDERALQNMRSEKQANDSLKGSLPKQDVFLVLDNLQDGHLDWPLLTHLSAKSKVVVTSRSLVNVVRVVGSHAFCLPCPTLTEAEALTLFVRSAGCTQPLATWRKEEMEILRRCIELSFLKNDFDSHHSSTEMLLRGCRHYPLVLKAHLETGEDMEALQKGIELSLSELNHSDSLLSSGSSEQPGHHNPLVLMAMGTTIKENYEMEPLQRARELMIKCKLMQRHPRRALSDVLRTREHNLTADEKLLFLDVALFYPIMNLGDVAFVDVLDRLLKWLETVDGSPRREILHKLAKLKDLNDSALNDHRKVHELFANIYTVLGTEGRPRDSPGNYSNGSIQCLDKAIEILTLQEASLEVVPGAVDLGVFPGRTEHGENYRCRAAARQISLDLKGAIEDLQKANDYTPNRAIVLQSLGTVRTWAEQYQEALELLNRAISLYPTTARGEKDVRKNYADAFAIRGYVKLRLHDRVGAKQDIDFARAIDPDCTNVQLFGPLIDRDLYWYFS